MQVAKAVEMYLEHHRSNSKSCTYLNYAFVLRSFSKCYGEKVIDSISTEEVITFLNHLTVKNGQS